jgi:hypothetical protein
MNRCVPVTILPSEEDDCQLKILIHNIFNDLHLYRHVEYQIY